MSLHIVQARDADGRLIGYLWRGKLVRHRASAAVYTSPSAAARAIDRAIGLAYLLTSLPAKPITSNYVTMPRFPAHDP